MVLRRNVGDLVRSVMTDTPVTMLQGGRQTGKSTLVAEIAREAGVQVYTMDDEDLRAAALADPASFIDSLGDGLVVLDEVQRAPGLVLPIKAAVDRRRRPGRFLLTGSADLMRTPGAEDSLAGRAATVELYPFSQGELGGVRDDFVSTYLAGLQGWSTAESRTDMVERIVAGGFPEMLTRAEVKSRGRWLDDYAARLVRRDAAELSRTSTSNLEAVLKLLAANQAGEVVNAQLARHVGVTESVIGGYLSLLESLYLIKRIPAWSRSLMNRRIKKAKCVVVDSGLCSRLNRLGAADYVSPLGVNHLGPALEGFVASELLRQATWSATEFTVSHYRESGRVEVDLVLELPGGRAIGVEVKATASPTARQFQGLRLLSQRLGESWAGGILFYLGTRVLPFGEGLLAVPVPALWADRA